MSIADKLITIAENEQRVFDSGRTKGYMDGNSEGYSKGYQEGYDKGISDTIESYPLAVSGTFIPEEDTKTFSLNGLNFTPNSIMVVCSSEIGVTSNIICENVLGISAPKGMNGTLFYTSSTGSNSLGTIKPTSSIVTWGEDGVNLKLPSVAMYFKKGLIYNYYVTGGIE